MGFQEPLRAIERPSWLLVRVEIVSEGEEAGLTLGGRRSSWCWASYREILAARWKLAGEVGRVNEVRCR